MAFLPALAQQLQPENTSTLALPLLFSRSLGQLCGPLLLNGQKMPDYVRRNHLLLGCLALFLLSYTIIPALAENIVLALAVIFVAHMASNVVFALGTFSVLHQFSEQHISGASARAMRWQTLWYVSLSALFGAVIVLFRFRQ